MRKMTARLIILLAFLTFSLCPHLLPVRHIYAQHSGNKYFSLLGTADLQGLLEPSPSVVNLGSEKKSVSVVGGIERIATIIKDNRNNSQGPLIVVSLGDDLMGQYFHYFHGKAILPLMVQAGYDIFALGNHEFDRGPGVLAEAIENANITPLCSDLDISNSSLGNRCDRFTVRQYDGFSVGFFSLMTEAFSTVTTTGNVKPIDTNITVAKEMVTILQQKKVDLIVALSHIGVQQDKKVASAVDGIDIIFGGHSHKYLDSLVTVNNTYIINGGEKGPAMVRLDVTLDKNNEILPASVKYTLIPVVDSILPHPLVSSALSKFKKELPQKVILGTTKTMWDLSKGSLRNSESSVADMITDLIKKKFNVDIALINSGSLRGNKSYPIGFVTDKMLREIDEFNNDIQHLQISGKVIVEILEHSANMINKGGFLQVSGIRYTINTNNTAQQLTSKGLKRIIAAGSKISNVTVWDKKFGWVPIDLSKTYTIATTTFLAQNGGDHYYWFKKFGEKSHNTYSTIYSILAEEITHSKTLNPAPIDGRILVNQ